MAMELDMQELTGDQRAACLDTVSPNTFFLLVADSLASRSSLSVVRMGDGERRLFAYCQNHKGRIEPPNSPFDEPWLRQFGCYGIDTGELENRLRIAAEHSSFFAPQIMGITRPEFAVAKVFAPRVRYVDNWFVRTWSKKLQNQLLSFAGRVLFIHGDEGVRESFYQAAESQCSVELLHMSTWQEAEETIRVATLSSAPLVLFAGGPANKYIAPLIANGNTTVNKVVLDLGQAAASEWI